MPGRQSHGRSLLGNSQSSQKGKGKNQRPKSKSKARAHALDAFAIASKQIQPKQSTRRGRGLEGDLERQHPRGGKKHRRDDDDDDDDDDEDSDEDSDAAPRKKRAKRSASDDEDGDSGGGSDSEGNEWHVGVNADDDDSELDSDEAFGESDDEKFEGFAFRGSSSQKKPSTKKKSKSQDEEEEDDDESEDDDDESLGSDAIDLADALDQSSGDEDESGSEGDTEDSGSEEESAFESEADDDDEVDASKLGDLHNLIQGLADTDKDDDAATNGPVSKQAISLEDLGLSGVKDPLIKKSVKLMKKEEKTGAEKKGTSKTLSVPLPRRQQDQLLRIAAYEKTNETLDRWTETVKFNRRADHLMFPLPQNAHDAGLDNGELLPLTKKNAGTELEQTIMTIMEESGLGPSAKQQQQQATKTDANGEQQTLSKAELKELWAQRRKERELESREQARAKRIKKIKSKTYRKIHRKERFCDEAALLEERRANGEIDSEEEREAAYRQGLLERVGLKHKKSKWARLGNKVGRAVWDEDFRAGLAEMHSKSEALRKRVDGRTSSGDEGQDDDSDDASDSGNEDSDKARLLKDLDAVDDAEGDDDHPHSGLMKLAFMQRAEAQRKQANDELISQIRRDLDSGSEQDDDDDDGATEAQVGRRIYGMGGAEKKAVKPGKDTASAAATEGLSNGSKSKSKNKTKTKSDTTTITTPVAAPESSVPGAGGAWTQELKSKGSHGKKSRKGTVGTAEAVELDLSSSAVQLAASKPAPAKAAATTTTKAKESVNDDGDDSSDEDIHLPLALRDHALISRAFAGEDVAGEFQAEKEAIMSEDDEKMIDQTMPGWGSWTGEGISKRARSRQKGKVMTKKEGIKKTDRKDAKLDKVIITEKRVRKNEKYLASQMPHPFESRAQYERSLRLPMGPEWMTKQSFQQATKPRVLLKQGIITPMAKPLL